MKEETGFTLVELMVATSVMLIIFGVVTSTYLITQRLWKGGFTQITLQSTARVALDKITRNLRSASAITAAVSDNGDKIRFVTDPNRTYNDPTDDITREYYISGTNIMYDPNTAISGDENILLRNVSKESTIPFFQTSNGLAVVTFRAHKDDALYGTHWSGMTTSINMRNI